MENGLKNEISELQDELMMLENSIADQKLYQ